MKVVKNLLSGLLMGVANVIPGLSGGTMLVLTNTFEPLTNAISDLFKKDNPKRFKDLLLIILVVLGLAVGILSLASLIPILNQYIFSQIMLFFIGVILTSSIIFIKNEIKEKKNFKLLWFLIGFILCATMVIFISATNENFVVKEKLSLSFLLTLFILSIVSGATMIFPGISGSLILYMFGMYYTIWGYIKETIFQVLKFQWNWNMVIPFIVIGFGILIGVILGSWLSKTLLIKFRYPTLSLILGLIIGGSIKLIPYPANLPTDIIVNWNFPTIITTILSFVLGIGIVALIQFLANKQLNKNTKKSNV